MKKVIIVMLAIPMLLAGCGQTKNLMTPTNPEIPAWLSLSPSSIQSISIQGWGPGASGDFVVYPTTGTSSKLINRLTQGLIDDEEIKPYATPISQGGGEWLELKMKNRTSISLAIFPNEPKTIQYIATLNSPSGKQGKNTMIKDVSGEVTAVFNAISQGKFVSQKRN